jgi:hypothetical protein
MRRATPRESKVMIKVMINVMVQIMITVMVHVMVQDLPNFGLIAPSSGQNISFGEEQTSDRSGRVQK